VRKLILAATALVLLIAGCTAVARLKALQPTTESSSPSVPLPSVLQPVRNGMMRRGIDIDAYTYPGQDIAAAASADVAYIERLHANALLVSFPFFMSGRSSNAVYASSSTPTPAQLSVLVQDAEQAGMYVSIRPLLDEGALGISRVYWSPVNQGAWFASYRHFLLPYAAMAQREHVQEFIVGAEFSIFADSLRWNALDRAVRSRFHGMLGCSNNWGAVAFLGDGSGTAFAGNCGQRVRESIDAYKPQHGDLLAGWEAFDSTLPRGTVETEVGIDAVKGAYKRPYQHQWTSAVSLDTSVQAHWFTAACHAAGREHLGGIYFWSLGLSQQPATGPTMTSQGAWAGGAGAQAISRCFAWLERGGE
jgi:hypothetical protein